MGNQCSGCNCKKDEAQIEVNIGEPSQPYKGEPPVQKTKKVNAGNQPDDICNESLHTIQS